MRKKLIVGNWKMHMNVSQASLFLHRLQEKVPHYADVEVVLTPSLLALQPLSVQLDRRKFRLAAPNAYFKDEGPYMGEVSFTMLRDLVHYAVVGHSERRIHFGETDQIVRDKVTAAFRNEIIPILCVGETQVERRAGETKQVIHDQVTTAISHLTTKEVESLVIAYEPVWAISTFGGIVAKPDDVKKEMDFVRDQVYELFGPKAAKEVRILYGGSVDDHTAGGYLSIEGCDGAIVGGASLHYEKFAKIVEAAHQAHGDEAKDN